jgi:hypothetical protein
MASKLKLIPDIAPKEMGWKCKVVVVEKTSSRTSQKGNGTYQHLWLMDTEVIFLDDASSSLFISFFFLKKAYLFLTINKIILHLFTLYVIILFLINIYRKTKSKLQYSLRISKLLKTP